MELNVMIIAGMVLFAVVGAGIVYLNEKLEEYKRSRRRNWYRV